MVSQMELFVSCHVFTHYLWKEQHIGKVQQNTKSSYYSATTVMYIQMHRSCHYKVSKSTFKTFESFALSECAISLLLSETVMPAEWSILSTPFWSDQVFQEHWAFHNTLENKWGTTVTTTRNTHLTIFCKHHAVVLMAHNRWQTVKKIKRQHSKWP